MTGLIVPGGDPTPGAMRKPAGFATCAAVRCNRDATIEILHAPGQGVGVWVPLCDDDLRRIPSAGLEYVTEVHGFVPATLKG